MMVEMGQDDKSPKSLQWFENETKRETNGLQFTKWQCIENSLRGRMSSSIFML